MSCGIASVTSYLTENEAKNVQNGDVHLGQIADFGMGYLKNHLAMALSFEHNFVLDRSFPLS